jgi:hypothetical protein
MKDRRKEQKVSTIFKDSSECLTKIEKLLKEIKIIPAK